jgi:hypothetical protein
MRKYRASGVAAFVFSVITVGCNSAHDVQGVKTASTVPITVTSGGLHSIEVTSNADTLTFTTPPGDSGGFTVGFPKDNSHLAACEPVPPAVNPLPFIVCPGHPVNCTVNHNISPSTKVYYQIREGLSCGPTANPDPIPYSVVTCPHCP